MTIKLYDTNAYETDFTGVVLECNPSVSGEGYELLLDKTLFFPEEGGQNCDSGTLNGIPVMDVQLRGDDILHTVNTYFAPGSELTGKIDWETRYSNMQQHSGEHIVSGLIHSLFGFDNVGFHLGSQAVTLDFNGFLEKEQLKEIERLANDAIYKNIKVLTEYPSPEKLSILSYRSKIAIDDPVRIVTFPGYDVCACCAPHVKRTGEIGMIKIVDAFRHRGGIRISILCGHRALQDFCRKQEQVFSISALLSAKPDAVADAVARLKEEIFSLKGEIIALQESLVLQKAAVISTDTNSLCLFENRLEAAAHRNYVNLLTEKCSGICAVFVGDNEAGYRYIIASKSEDVRPFNEKLKKEFDAKGGGSKEMVQGSVLANEESLRNSFVSL